MSAAREHEREVVVAAVRAVCAEWGFEVRTIEHPEDFRPQPERPVDGLVSTNDGGIAVEHTLYQSLVGEVEDGHQITSTLGPLVRRVSGTLPIPGVYLLGVSVGAVAGHGRTDLARLEDWIRATAPTLTVGRTYRGATNVAHGSPPEVPFPVVLARHKERSEEQEGALEIRRNFDLDELPAQNIEQAIVALSKKLPKLAEHRPRGGRTLLVFEDPDIQLVNPDSATDAVRAALEARPDLAEPDAVVLVNTFSAGWVLIWIKDGPVWHPETEHRLVRALDRS